MSVDYLISRAFYVLLYSWLCMEWAISRQQLGLETTTPTMLLFATIAGTMSLLAGLIVKISSEKGKKDVDDNSST